MSAIRANVPRHIGIIMDGNGRWAEGRGLPRWQGHLAGAENVEPIALYAINKGVKHFTVYALSLDNLEKRPSPEVQMLFKIFFEKLDYGGNRFNEENVRVRVVGDVIRLPEDLRQKIREVEESTKFNTRGTFVSALAYEGRNEILRAARKAREDNSDDLFAYLDAPDIPNLDLIIRTGLDDPRMNRLSGFMLARAAYAEQYGTRTYWPAFTIDELEQALGLYAERERRLGAVRAS